MITQRHINGYRPLRDGENWVEDRTEPADLVGGFRPLLVDEVWPSSYDYSYLGERWVSYTSEDSESAVESHYPQHRLRTREPLPE